jgi:hypothetical protein
MAGRNWSRLAGSDKVRKLQKTCQAVFLFYWLAEPEDTKFYSAVFAGCIRSLFFGYNEYSVLTG